MIMFGNVINKIKLLIENRGVISRLDPELAEVAEAVWKNKWRLARTRQQLARGYKEVIYLLIDRRIINRLYYTNDLIPRFVHL